MQYIPRLHGRTPLQNYLCKHVFHERSNNSVFNVTYNYNGGGFFGGGNFWSGMLGGIGLGLGGMLGNILGGFGGGGCFGGYGFPGGFGNFGLGGYSGLFGGNNASKSTTTSTSTGGTANTNNTYNNTYVKGSRDRDQAHIDGYRTELDALRNSPDEAKLKDLYERLSRHRNNLIDRKCSRSNRRELDLLLNGIKNLASANNIDLDGTTTPVTTQPAVQQQQPIQQQPIQQQKKQPKYDFNSATDLNNLISKLNGATYDSLKNPYGTDFKKKFDELLAEVNDSQILDDILKDNNKTNQLGSQLKQALIDKLAQLKQSQPQNQNTNSTPVTQPVDLNNLPQDWNKVKDTNPYIEAIRKLDYKKDHGTLVALAQNSNIPVDVRQAAKKKFYEHFNISDNVTQADIDGLNNGTISAIDTSDTIGDFINKTYTTQDQSGKKIIKIKTSSSIAVQYKFRKINHDGEAVFISFHDQQEYILQRGQDGQLSLMQYEWNRGHDKGDVTTETINSPKGFGF